MSIWLQGRREGRNRVRYSVGVPFEALLFLAAIVCSAWAGAFMHSPDVVCTAALTCLASGLTFIAAAKASLFRRGIWSSWGAGSMTRPFTVCYRLGYVLLAVGTLTLLARILIGW